MHHSHTSRRGFFTRSAGAAVLAGLGAAPLHQSSAADPDAAPSFGRILRFATGAVTVRDVAAGPAGEILVAGDRSLRLFSHEGTLQARFELDAEPFCLAATADRIWIGFARHVEAWNRDGKRLLAGPSIGPDVALTSLAVVGDRLFATDGHGRRIRRLDAHGRPDGEIRRAGKDFAVPDDFFPIAAAGDRLVVSDLGRHRVETYDVDGARTASWGERRRDLAGFGGCCNPVSLAVTPAGDVVTAEGGLPRIKLFDPAGRLRCLVAGPDDLEANARGSNERAPTLTRNCQSGGLELAVDPDGRIFALDRVTAEVHVFARA